MGLTKAPKVQKGTNSSLSMKHEWMYANIRQKLFFVTWGSNPQEGECESGMFEKELERVGRRHKEGTKPYLQQPVRIDSQKQQRMAGKPAY
jgi:hypothetical protein